MRLLSLAILAFTLFLPVTSLRSSSKLPKDAILLSSVQSLTLRSTSITSHRRVPAIPQLTCAGPGCKHHIVELMHCQNMGADYDAGNIQWSCIASLPEDFKLGETEVVCEGYKNADDEAVLKGSCGVSYRLLLTEKGEERYGTNWWGQSRKGAPMGVYNTPVKEESTDLGGWLFGALFVAVSVWIIYKFLTAVADQPGGAPRQPRNGGGNWGNGWGGGGGGGGWDGNDDSPPPYPGKTSGGGQGWKPGFWSGTAAGVAAAYAAGAARGARGGRNETREVPRTGSGGWSGGGNTGNTGGSSSSTWASPSRNNSGGSGSRYESTGFGSTTRR
ncbi:transmembrane protein [Calycina marina]|uniref:Store-operated calcium entry-associated regulatory factor n=1 Tax=Calycina marina TaxID=1763456 RepID=A0A9P7Z978_9HELO|nr:transmembrane protein [Calycina marina]